MKILVLIAMQGKNFEMIEEPFGVTLTLIYSANIVFNVLLALGVVTVKILKRCCKKRYRK